MWRFLLYQAAVLVTTGYNYIGASGDINIWNPYVDSTDDYTTAQIWLKGGPGDNFESIEAGWVVSAYASFDFINIEAQSFTNYISIFFFQVNPKLYGDKLTRLFIYWTVSTHQFSLKFLTHKWIMVLSAYLLCSMFI